MIRTFYLVCCIFTSCLVAEQAPKYALLGETVSLDPFGVTISPDEILWKHKGDKVVEFNGNEQDVFGTFHNRITLDWLSAELNISNLRYEDRGVYAVEAYTNGELKRAFFTLEVIDPVAKPTISCEMSNGSSSIKSGNQATLKCSAESRLSPSLTKFEWSSHGKTQPGENLIITLGDEYDDEVYDCTVSNPLTKESTTFTAKDCYPAGGSAGLTAGVSVAVIAIILIILGVLFCKLKQKACFAKEKEHDVEKPPINKGSGNMEARDDERRGLIHRESTLASEDSDREYRRESVKKLKEKYERRSGKKEEAGLENNAQIPAVTFHPLDSAGDADVHSSKGRLVEMRDPSDFNESGYKSENKTSDLQPPAASEQPVLEESKQIPDSAENNKEDPDVHSPKELPEEDRDPSGDENENKTSDLQPTTASEQPGAEKEADEKPESLPENDVPLQPHLPETENSQIQSPQDGSGEDEDQTVSDQQDQDTAGNNEGDSSEPGEGKQPEDVNKTTSEQNMDPPAETPKKVKELRNFFEPNDENQNAKGLEKNEQIPAVTLQPLDSAENNKEDPDVHLVKELPEEDCDPSDSKKSNDASGDENENKMSDLQPTTASEQPVLEESKQIPDSAENNKEDPDVHSPKELPEEDRDPSDFEKSNDASGDENENKTSDLQPTTASEQPENVKALRNVFEPNDENQKAKGSEEDKQKLAATLHPQDSAESNKGVTDVETPKVSAENKDCDPLDSEKSNVASDDKSEKAESDQQPPTTSELSVSTEYVKKRVKEWERQSGKHKAAVKQEEDDGEDASLPADPPVSPLMQDSLNAAPQDGAGKQEEDSSSDHVTGENTDLSLNESNDHSDARDNSTISEEKDPETTDEQSSQQKQTHQGEDGQQKSDNSEDKHDSDSADEQEKIDQDKKVPPDPQ